MRQDLQGRVIVVTGASSGVGKRTARALGRSGARVVLTARRGDYLDDLVKAIVAEGGEAFAVAADVSDARAMRDLARTVVTRFGRIDVWINNAAIGAVGAFWTVPSDVHARVVEVNVNGLIFGAHAALNRFVEQRSGTLINVASVASDVPLAYQSSYAASKAAVLSLGRAVNEELRRAHLHRRIAVCSVLPWALATPWWRHTANYTGRSARMLGLGDPERVVEAILTLCARPVAERRISLMARMTAFAARALPRSMVRVAAMVAHVGLMTGKPAPRTRGSVDRPVPD